MFALYRAVANFCEPFSPAEISLTSFWQLGQFSCIRTISENDGETEREKTVKEERRKRNYSSSSTNELLNNSIS